MKTFRWTIPEPPLSEAERRSHRASRSKRSAEDPQGDKDELTVEPRNWRERWALHALNQQRSMWSPTWIVLYAGFMSFIHYNSEEYRGFVWFLWIFVALMIDQSIRAAAIHSILKRQSEQGGDLKPDHAPS